MAKHDYGRKTLTINGSEYVLNVTPAALDAIDDRFGSIAEAAQSLRKPAQKNLAYIVYHGARLNKGDYEQLKEDIFQEGVLNVAGMLSDYMVALMNPTGNEDDAEPGEGKA